MQVFKYLMLILEKKVSVQANLDRVYNQTFCNVEDINNTKNLVDLI